MPPKPVGSVIIDGCMPSAGYVWCEILNQCIRTWITICEIPTECLTWNDGCNTCSVTDGKIGACTEMMCFQRDQPQCIVWTPGTMNIMPVVDYAPPVINPFIGGGH